MDDVLINATDEANPAAYKASANAKSGLLKLKASLVKEKTLPRQYVVFVKSRYPIYFFFQ